MLDRANSIGSYPSFSILQRRNPLGRGMLSSGVLPTGIACMFLGCLAVYGALFATGSYIYGNHPVGALLTALAVISTLMLVRMWGRLGAR